MGIKTVITSDLDIPLALIDEALRRARLDVKQFHIPKRNGGKRIIVQPARKLKTIQYWLIINIFSRIEVHNVAFAYRDTLSILHNAQQHQANKYFLKMDLKDFFPSIKFLDLLPIIRAWHAKEKPKWELDKEAIEVIRLSCFYKNDTLPIGYPSSPIISNIVMFQFDSIISTLVGDKNIFGNVVYTRYADDLVFSTDKPGVSKALIDAITEHIEKLTTPNLTVNKNKTRVGSSTGGTALVTGLRVCNEGHITIPRKQKDHIRLLLSLYSKAQLKRDDFKSLRGHLAYTRHVAPAFYSKLQEKYFSEIAALKNERD